MSDLSRRGKAAKRKGGVGELEVRDILREHGWLTAHRNFQSGGQGGGDLADAIPDVHIEVKRHETVALSTWWRQATRDARPSDTVIVVHRGNMQPWMVTLLLIDAMAAYDDSPYEPVVVTGSNPRAVFMAELRHGSPFVVHRVGGLAMATVLFEDWLRWQRAPRDWHRA